MSIKKVEETLELIKNNDEFIKLAKTEEKIGIKFYGDGDKRTFDLSKSETKLVRKQLIKLAKKNRKKLVEDLCEYSKKV